MVLAGGFVGARFDPRPVVLHKVPSLEPPARISRTFPLVLAGVLALRVFYAVASPLDLAPDEAFYWDWGRRLDWCYVSKPPLIAWSMRLAGALGGDSVVGIRLVAVVLGALTLCFSYLLARELFGRAAAAWVVLIQIATPGTVGLNGLLTIDAPLAAAWSAALWLFWRVSDGRAGAWTRAGLTAALAAGILAKQMMLVFPLMAALFLALDRRGAAGRWRAWAWSSGIALAATLTPILIWNARHSWALFAHSSEHFTASELAGLLSSWRTFSASLGEQVGLGGGLLWVLVCACLVAASLAWRRLERRARFLLLFSAPGLIAIALLSLRQSTHANWPLVYYASAWILTAGWIAGSLPELRLAAAWRRCAGPGVVLGLALVLLFYAYVWAAPALGLAGGHLDPSARLRGWREFGRAAGELIADSEEPPVLVLLGPGRAVASALAFYAPGRPRVHTWREDPAILTQYDLWGGPADPIGRDFVFFLEQPELPRSWRRCFDSVEDLGLLRAQAGTVLERAVRVVHGTNLRGLPDPLGTWRATSARPDSP